MWLLFYSSYLFSNYYLTSSNSDFLNSELKCSQIVTITLFIYFLTHGQKKLPKIFDVKVWLIFCVFVCQSLESTKRMVQMTEEVRGLILTSLTNDTWVRLKNVVIYHAKMLLSFAHCFELNLKFKNVYFCRVWMLGSKQWLC